MMQQQKKKLSDRVRAAQSAAVAAGLGVVLLATLTLPADARGGHGFGRNFGGHGLHGPQLAGGRSQGNDAYTNAASEEADKLLNSKLKSICRGC